MATKKTSKTTKKSLSKTQQKTATVSKKPQQVVAAHTAQEPKTTLSPQSRLVKEKAQDLKQLFSHAVVYIAVNLFLIFINFTTSPNSLWFYWVMIGWGIGLAFHWLDVMNYTPFDESWAEEEAKKILQPKQPKK